MPKNQLLQNLHEDPTLRNSSILACEETQTGESIYLALHTGNTQHEFYIWKNAVAYFSELTHREFKLEGEWDMSEIMKTIHLCMGGLRH